MRIRRLPENSLDEMRPAYGVSHAVEGSTRLDEAAVSSLVFVGFPRNFKSRVERESGSARLEREVPVIRYEEPLSETVPYEEMGLSRFL